jgi:hypothetical protein
MLQESLKSIQTAKEMEFVLDFCLDPWVEVMQEYWEETCGASLE